MNRRRPFSEPEEIPGLRGIVCGENFTFGAGAAGTPEELVRYFAGTDVSVSVVPLMRSGAIGGRVISSTEIRRLVQEGDMRTAACLLGRPYVLSGGVTRGFRRGTEDTGFPTANLSFGKNGSFPQTACTPLLHRSGVGSIRR